MVDEQNMETENPSVEENIATESQEQTESKAFSQDDVDRILKDRLDRERKRFEKKFADVDVEKYRELMDREESARIEEQKKRGEFEDILKSTVAKKDSQITELQQQLHSIKVEGSLLNAASAKRAINPQQVVSLLNNQIRLGDTGDAEVIDANGQVRYTDQGTAMTPDQLVEEFLQTNSHFVSAGPSGSGPQSSVANSSRVASVDTNSLDMNNPDDRKIYKDLMKKKGIRI